MGVSMKLRTFILAGSLGLVACMAARPANNTGLAVVANEPTDKAEPISLSVVEDKFYVNIEFIVFQQEIDQYPETWKHFQAALDEWRQHIPVRWVVLVEDHALPFSISGRMDSIEVHMIDLQSDPYNLPNNLLGMWLSDGGKILLDADFLENDARAYSVCLHELGHMLGVPHIISFDELGYTGYVVLPPEQDATNFVMYPSSVSNNPQKQLSPIEIGLAYHNLLHYWTRPDVNHKTEDCRFSVDK